MEKEKGLQKVTEAQRCNEIVCRTNSLITMLTFFNNQIIQDSKKIPETLEKIQVETQNYRDRLDKCVPSVN